MQIEDLGLFRRDLLRMALGTGALGLVSMLTPSVLAQKAKSPTENDFAILNFAVELEQKAVNTYLSMAEKKLLKGKEYLDIAKQFAADHSSHKEALINTIKGELKMEPPQATDPGTFPLPEIKKDVDAVRYALTLEAIAAKTYYEAFRDKLKTKPGRAVFLDICAVESQHVGVFRTLLVFKLKDKNLPDNAKIVPYPLMESYPTPALPQSTEA